MAYNDPIRVLCYGDSNTWGYTAGTGVRYAHDVRWTGVLQRELGQTKLGGFSGAVRTFNYD